MQFFNLILQIVNFAQMLSLIFVIAFFDFIIVFDIVVHAVHFSH